jgi:hypothetical protein
MLSDVVGLRYCVPERLSSLGPHRRTKGRFQGLLLPIPFSTSRFQDPCIFSPPSCQLSIVRHLKTGQAQLNVDGVLIHGAVSERSTVHTVVQQLEQPPWDPKT